MALLPPKLMAKLMARYIDNSIFKQITGETLMLYGIKKIYRDNPNAFKRGCSKETMARIVNDAVVCTYTAKEIRKSLDDAAESGEMIKGKNPRTGFTTYRLKEEFNMTVSSYPYKVYERTKASLLSV